MMEMFRVVEGCVMHRRTIPLISLASAILLIAAPGWAQEATGPWPGFSADDLPEIYVLDDTGVEVGGRLLELDADGLALLVDDVRRRYDRSNIRRIDRRGDSLRNGAVIGAVIGAGFGALLSGMADCPSGGAGCAAARLSFVIVNTGLYAGMGVGIDALVAGRTTIYVAPDLRQSSDGTGRQAGVRFAFSW